MSINKELNESELENAFGGAIKAQDLPDKFKSVGGTYIDENGEIVRGSGNKNEEIISEDIPTFTAPDELSETDLEKMYGGPIKAKDLPDSFYKNKK